MEARSMRSGKAPPGVQGSTSKPPAPPGAVLGKPKVQHMQVTRGTIGFDSLLIPLRRSHRPPVQEVLTHAKREDWVASVSAHVPFAVGACRGMDGKQQCPPVLPSVVGQQVPSLDM
eukprot:262702-Amphidinium_carterae.1